MKKHLTRAFSLLLALIMVVGAVPFAMAAEPTVEIRSNKDNVWPGQTVTLTMEASEATSGVAWDNGERSNSISYTVPEDAVGTDTVGVTVSFGGPSDQISKSASITLNINEPAESISISGGASEAAVGESVKFDATTAPSGNDSEIAWSVSPAGASVSNGRFKATEDLHCHRHRQERRRDRPCLRQRHHHRQGCGLPCDRQGCHRASDLRDLLCLLHRHRC